MKDIESVQFKYFPVLSLIAFVMTEFPRPFFSFFVCTRKAELVSHYLTIARGGQGLIMLVILGQLLDIFQGQLTKYGGLRSKWIQFEGFMFKITSSIVLLKNKL